jgi:ribosome biogenesis GTPase
MDTIAQLVEGKQTLFTGHSGVGKSTIINALLPHLALRTMEVSDWSGKGMHTTTYAEMFDLDKTGTIIDTPGIRELGIVQTTREELGGYFVEIKQHAVDCKFNNCIHSNEPNCAVIAAVNNKQISTERYYSYLNIMESLNTKTY